MQKRFNTLTTHPWGVPVVLLLLAFLTYGLLSPWLGFYWDDWFYIWTWHSMGTQGPVTALGGDRPAQGWLYSTLLSVFGLSPLPWQLLMVFAYWLAALGVYWTLSNLWSQKKVAALAIAILFLVYPGFSLQPLAFTFSQENILPLAIYMFSLGATVTALRQPQRFRAFYAFALLTCAVQLILTEYYVGLEMFRLFLIWYVVSDTIVGFKPRLRRTLRLGVPFLLLVAARVVFYLLFLDSTAQPDKKIGTFLRAILSDPIGEIPRRIGYVFTDTLQATLVAWARTLPPNVLEPHDRAAQIALFVTLVGTALIGVYLWAWTSRTPEPNADARPARTNWAMQAVLLGLVALVCAQLPLWLTDRPISFYQAEDRHSMTAMLGAAMLIIGGVALLVKSPRYVLVVAVLGGLAMGFHFRNQNEYRLDWQRHKEMLWQLTWRAPALDPKTTLFVYQRPWSIPQPKDYTLSMPINFTYANDHKASELDYWMYSDAQPYSARWVDLITANTETSGAAEIAPTARKIRNITITGNPTKVLVLTFIPPACLRVMDATSYDLPQLPPLVNQVKPFSDVKLIRAADAPPRPPQEIFGAEPERGWCYYFERADWARQNGDWETVAGLGDRAQKLGLAPRVLRTRDPESGADMVYVDRTEWLPFVEGYMHTGRYAEAKKVLRLAVYGDQKDAVKYAIPDYVSGAQRAACLALRHIGATANLDASGEDALAAMNADLACTRLEGQTQP